MLDNTHLGSRPKLHRRKTRLWRRMPYTTVRISKCQTVRLLLGFDGLEIGSVRCLQDQMKSRSSALHRRPYQANHFASGSACRMMECLKWQFLCSLRLGDLEARAICVNVAAHKLLRSQVMHGFLSDKNELGGCHLPLLRHTNAAAAAAGVLAAYSHTVAGSHQMLHSLLFLNDADISSYHNLGHG